MTHKSTDAPDTLALLREMYTDFDDAQLLEAREHITAYVAVVLRIYERLEAERAVRNQTSVLTDPEK